MIAFDSDVLTRILAGDATIAPRLTPIPLDQQLLPIVVVEEAIRGRLNSIRQAEAGKGKISLETAYGNLERTISGICAMRVLSYTAAAHSLVENWRKQKIKVGIRDMRIAALCSVHGVTLATSNARDFSRIPGLVFEIW